MRQGLRELTLKCSSTTTSQTKSLIKPSNNNTKNENTKSVAKMLARRARRKFGASGAQYVTSTGPLLEASSYRMFFHVRLCRLPHEKFIMEAGHDHKEACSFEHNSVWEATGRRNKTRRFGHIHIIYSELLGAGLFCIRGLSLDNELSAERRRVTVATTGGK